MRVKSHLTSGRGFLKKKHNPKRKAPLTVCIAAICESSIIYAAVDRMMTSGDVEFEPDLDSIPKYEFPTPLKHQANTNPKIVPITNSITAMTAGDSGLQTEITQQLYHTVRKRIESDPQRLVLVKEVVDDYVEIYNKTKMNRLRNSVFAPFGLTEDTFFSKQSQMSKEFVAEITKQIREFETYFINMHGVDTIFVGIDDSFLGAVGPHIYTVVKSSNGDGVICCDSVGFAAVGSGARHAESQFMLARHSRYASLPDTVLLTYLAKKRSEVAPGVGKGTDMFTIGPIPGSFAMLDMVEDFDLGKIDSIYKSIENGQSKVLRKAKEKSHKYIDDFIKGRVVKFHQAQQQTPLPKPEIAPPASSEGQEPKS
jgi:hypothetical protein